jgi:isoquinoline 1-oxidoreductase beta subunit
MFKLGANPPVLHGATVEPSGTLTRRGFLISASSAGFAMAFTLPEPSNAAAVAAAHGADPGLVADGDAKVVAGATAAFEPTIWYDIDRDGIVTVNIIRAEMGQHVGTALARIVADELDVDWASVRLRYVDTDPKWGTMVTGGSWSVWQSFPYLSQAGAAGRLALIEEGAKLLHLDKAACTAREGVVRGAGKSLSYAEIVRHGQLARHYTADELKAMPIKVAAERRLIGQPTAALDIPAKTTGAARYGLDAQVPGMAYARPKLPPTRNGCKVSAIDDSAARGIPGYLKSIVLDDPSGTVPGWVVVCADSFVAANRAADLVKVTWASSAAATVSEADIQAHALKLITDAAGGALVVEDAGVDAAFSAAKSTLERDYTTATVLHFQLEPLNALALQKDGRWEVHTGNQWQSLILPTLAKALGVPETQVVMRTYLIGGGFGRRLNGDYAVPAALAAKALGRPVKLVWTRADDVRFDSPRSPSVQRLRVAFGANGQVTGMQHHACAGWPTQVMMPSFMPKGHNGVPYDPFAIAGADHWYSVGSQRVRAVSNDLANNTFRPGWLRSVGPGWTNWALESFMDEAAHAAGVDPLTFRLHLLAGQGKNGIGGAPRQSLVLQRAADKAGWGSKMPADTGLGIATTFGQERDMPTWCACVARVHVNRINGVVKVEQLTVVVDAGTIVHPDGALAQVEGASLWGLSMALFEGTEFVNGQVRDTNLNTYTPLRMRDVPPLDIEFIPSTVPPTGLGEPATTVVGPAIGNAIFAAVGIRLRHLPMRPADVLAALKLA